MKEGLTITGLAITIAIVALFAGYFIGISGIHSQTPTSEYHATSYNIALVETMDNYIGTSMQPGFFIATQGGLTPASNISLPAHTLIVLTITSYDTPTPGSSASYSNVTGTLGNTLSIINGTIATGSLNMSMTQKWETNVTSIPADQLAHTITVSQIGLNIPTEGGFTEIAEFYVNSTGSYTWQCMTPCGTGPSGWGGAMATAGWMVGTFYVY